MAAWGYAQGLIVGALSLAGFAGGAILGSRLGPLLVEDGSASPYAPLMALIGAIVVGGVLASGLELLGFHLRGRLGDGHRRARRPRRGAAGRLPRPRAGVDLRRGRAADAGRARAARADPALGHPARAERAPAALRTDPEGARALRPAAADRRPRGRRGAAERAHRARPGGARRRRQRRARARHGLRARGAGQRLGRRRGRRRHQRARRRRPGRHDGAGRRRRADRGRRGDLVRPAQRPRDPARAGRGRRAGAAAAHERARRHRGGDPGLPAQRPLRPASRSPRRDAADPHPGRLRARARCRGGSPRSAGWCAPATPAARSSTGTGACSRRSSRPPSTTAVVTASACRTRSSHPPCSGPAGRSTPVPAHADRYNYPLCAAVLSLAVLAAAALALGLGLASSAAAPEAATHRRRTRIHASARRRRRCAART